MTARAAAGQRVVVESRHPAAAATTRARPMGKLNVANRTLAIMDNLAFLRRLNNELSLIHI